MMRMIPESILFLGVFSKDLFVDIPSSILYLQCILGYIFKDLLVDMLEIFTEALWNSFMQLVKEFVKEVAKANTTLWGQEDAKEEKIFDADDGSDEGPRFKDASVEARPHTIDVGMQTEMHWNKCRGFDMDRRRV